MPKLTATPDGISIDHLEVGFIRVPPDLRETVDRIIAFDGFYPFTLTMAKAPADGKGDWLYQVKDWTSKTSKSKAGGTDGKGK